MNLLGDRGISRHVTSIDVENLFGHLDYHIAREPLGSELDDLLIIYGDNGSGKTTILKLLFNTLSCVPGGGRKTYIAQTPFSLFRVTLGYHSVITVTKKRLIGTFEISILHNRDDKAETFKVGTTPDGAVRSEGNQIDALMAALRRLELSLYFLPDDRKVQSNLPEEFAAVGLVSRPYLSRSAWREDQAVHYLTHSALFPRADEDSQTESHHLNIKPILSTLTNTLRREAIQGSTIGEENAGSIYLRVVEGVKMASFPRNERRNGDHALERRIISISQKVHQFSRFGLHGIFPSEKLMAALREASLHDRTLITTILEPYLEGLEARFTALQDLYDVVSTYIDTMNSFLSNKTIGFDVQTGISVMSKWGDVLDPDMLSSGERQLLLLLSNTLIARKSPTIFIIDEPELSLNVKWQRKLVTALLRCSQGGGIQYILASHSIELISQYRESTTRLGPV